MDKDNSKQIQQLAGVKVKAPLKTPEEERTFFVNFSKTQLNTVLVLILAATFLVQGVGSFFEGDSSLELFDQWFGMVSMALLFLVLSVVSISVNTIVSTTRFKRKINLISCITFFAGFFFFVGSLMFLLLLHH